MLELVAAYPIDDCVSTRESDIFSLRSESNSTCSTVFVTVLVILLRVLMVSSVEMYVEYFMVILALVVHYCN